MCPELLPFWCVILAPLFRWVGGWVGGGVGALAPAWVIVKSFVFLMTLEALSHVQLGDFRSEIISKAWQDSWHGSQSFFLFDYNLFTFFAGRGPEAGVTCVNELVCS